jgi:hypothetical protein
MLILILGKRGKARKAGDSQRIREQFSVPQTVWWCQSRANPSLPKIPVNRKKYREMPTPCPTRAYKTSMPSAFLGFSPGTEPIRNRERTGNAGNKQELNKEIAPAAPNSNSAGSSGEKCFFQHETAVVILSESTTTQRPSLSGCAAFVSVVWSSHSRLIF